MDAPAIARHIRDVALSLGLPPPPPGAVDVLLESHALAERGELDLYWCREDLLWTLGAKGMTRDDADALVRKLEETTLVNDESQLD